MRAHKGALGKQDKIDWIIFYLNRNTLWILKNYIYIVTIKNMKNIYKIFSIAQERFSGMVDCDKMRMQCMNEWMKGINEWMNEWIISNGRKWTPQNYLELN